MATASAGSSGGGDSASDITHLLPLVSLEQLESLYGRELVHSQAKIYLKNKPGFQSSSGQLRDSFQGSKAHILCRLHQRQCEGLLDDAGIVESVLESLEEEPDATLMCPLSMRPFRDPVVLSTGFVVERDSVFMPESDILRIQRCPFSRQELVPLVYPVHIIKEKAREWRLRRLDGATSAAELFISQEMYDAARKVFDIAERLLEDVGEQYVHEAKRIAAVEWHLPEARSTPEQAAKIYKRLARVMITEERAELVKAAVVEFIARASVCLDEARADRAAAWTEGAPALWLQEQSISELWDDKRQGWCEVGLRVAMAADDAASAWMWRRRLVAVLRKQGGGEALDVWLKSQALTGREKELVGECTPGFDVTKWSTRNTDWIDMTSGRVRVGGSNGFVQAVEDFGPMVACDWFLEVAFKADSLHDHSFNNVVISKQGISKQDHNAGWEVRVGREEGVMFIWTQGPIRFWNGLKIVKDTCVRGPPDVQVAPGLWMHVGVAFQAQKSTITLFVNGVAGAEHTVGSLLVCDTQPCLLGRNPECRDRQFVGLVAHAAQIHRLPEEDDVVLLEDVVCALSQKRLSSLVRHSSSLEESLERMIQRFEASGGSWERNMSISTC